MALPKLLKRSLPRLADVQKQQASTLIEDRPLSSAEAEFLTHVLANCSEQANSFLEQVPFTKVISHCGCGYPTVGLEVSHEAPRGTADGRVIVDLLGRTPNGAQVGVLVFADNGVLSLLEIYELDEPLRPFSLPTIESLHPFETANANR